MLEETHHLEMASLVDSQGDLTTPPLFVSQLTNLTNLTWGYTLAEPASPLIRLYKNIVMLSQQRLHRKVSSYYIYSGTSLKGLSELRTQYVW